MKGFAVPIFILLAVFAVSFAAVFDAKSDAIKAIQDSYKDAEYMKKSILVTIANEQKNANASTGEKDLLKQFDNKITDLKLQFEADADNTIRKAIIQSKPIAVIDCISKVADGARNYILEATNTFKTAIMDIKIKKYQKINFDDYTVNAIMKGLKELTDQSLAKLNEKDADIPKIRKEALQRCESAHLLLGEIEIRVGEPVLNREYIKMKQQIDRELRNLQTDLGAELEKCLNNNK